MFSSMYNVDCVPMTTSYSIQNKPNRSPNIGFNQNNYEMNMAYVLPRTFMLPHEAKSSSVSIFYRFDK